MKTKQFYLKHLFFWVFTVCLLLALLRRPVGYALLNFPYYWFTRPLVIGWGWILGFNPEVNGPGQNCGFGEAIGFSFGVLLAAISFLVAIFVVSIILDGLWEWVNKPPRCENENYPPYGRCTLPEGHKGKCHFNITDKSQ